MMSVIVTGGGGVTGGSMVKLEYMMYGWNDLVKNIRDGRNNFISYLLE